MRPDPRPGPLAAIPLPRAAALGDPTVALAAAALLAAVVVGVALAADTAIGIAILIIACYVPLVLVNLPLGLALWVPLIFLQGVPVLNLGGKAAAVLIVVAWLGIMRSTPETAVAVLQRHRRLLFAVAGLAVWFTLSLIWADDPKAAIEALWPMYALVTIFVVTITVVTTRQSLILVAMGFVAGAVLSVSLGVLDGSLTSALNGAARAEGGAGDPNFLASSIVAATVLAGGLMAVTRSPLQRLALAAAVVILIAGLIGTASRGGFLAAGITTVVAIVVFRRRRAHLVAAVAVITSVVALTLLYAPATWERVTNYDDDNGRSDLWYVAWEMSQDNPVAGVGINNFLIHISDYVQAPGGVEDVSNLVDQPHFVHNTYLQVLTEGGIVALVLFLGMVGACLRATKQAADRFARGGRRTLEILAQAVLVATISMLAASVFLSAAFDPRLWLLLALGPALLTVARRGADEELGEVGQGGSEQAPPLPVRPKLGGV